MGVRSAHVRLSCGSQSRSLHKAMPPGMLVELVTSGIDVSKVGKDIEAIEDTDQIGAA